MSDDRITQLEERIAALESIVRQQPIRSDCLYTTAEVATWLRCSKTNVYDLLLSGDLASTRVGAGKAGKRVRGSDITAFLEERTEGGPQPRMAFKHLKGFR